MKATRCLDLMVFYWNSYQTVH